MTRNFARLLVLSCVALMATLTCVGYWFFLDKSSDAGTGLAFGDSKKFDAGDYHTLAIENGKLYAWGSNQYGQVGNNSTLNISYPVRIGETANWVSVAAGNLHSLAINESGELYAWGQNKYGQLGLGNTVDKTVPTKVGSATNWVMAAAGVGHSLAINSDGELFAWGLNDFGQLGNSTTVNELQPVQIGLGQDWTFVEAGYIHSYAINSNGNLFSWGANGAGQLGLGDTDDRHEPTLVGVLEDEWETISAGTLHTLALNKDNDLFTWGDNSCEQFGDLLVFGENVLEPNSLEYTANAIAAGHNHSISIRNGKIYAWGGDELGQFDGNEQDFGSNFVSVVAGHSHSFVMDADGILYAWGNNEYGQLGNGTTFNSSELQRVLPFLSIFAPDSGTGFTVSNASVSELRPNELGSFTFEITRDVGYNPPQVVLNPTKGILVHLETIGNTSYYEVNNVSDSINDDDFYIQMSLEEYNVSVPSNITELSVSAPSQSLVEYGGSYTFTITVDLDYADPLINLSVNGDLTHTSTVKGETTKTLTYTVSNVAGIIDQSDFNINLETLYTATPTTLSIGQWHSLTIIDGELWAWGNNSKGQLGTGNTTAKSLPVRVGNQDNWLSVAVGELHSLALNLNGELYAWGDNAFGQLGNGDNLHSYTPIRIGENQTWASVFASGNVSYAINNVGEIFAWGNNSNGQIGDGTIVDKNIPTLAGVAGSWISVAGGYDFTLAIDVYGRLFSWGGNGAGQLGSGDTISVFTPTQVGTDEDWAFVSAGTLHVLAIKSNGTLYAWGTNESGQLGLGNNVARLTPEKVGTANNWVSVSAGHNHSLATNSLGELFAWGRNTENQFGNGNATSNNVVTKIGTATDWAKVSAGFSSSVAMKTNGKIYAAGNNTYNQIGDGTAVNKNNWINVLPLLEVTPPTAISGATIDGSDALVTPSGNGTYTFTITSQEGYTNGAPSVTLTPGKGTLGTPVKNGNVTTYTITNILENITISDVDIVIPINISAPNSDTGFTVQALAKNWVLPSESFQFTITKNPSYSDPIVTIDVSLATISAPVIDGNNFTFTVSNITAPISALDFTVNSELVAHVVASPYSVGGYTVSAPSSNPVDDTGSYTFTVTKSEGYANPTIELNQNGSVALTSEDGNVLTYTVSNVIGQITSNDFTFTRNVNVTAPSSATGYSISSLSKTVVAVGTSYTFVVEAENGYNNKAPLVTLSQNGILSNIGSTYTVSNVSGPITADDFAITVYVNVSAPSSATGFTVGSPAQNWVEYGASYTFTITPHAGYNNKAPLVEFIGTMSKDGNSYTIDNIIDPISADDFDVRVYVNVAAPNAGTGYVVSGLAQNWVEYGESYTFTITPQTGFTNKAPTVAFGGTMSKDGNTYTVSNVTAPITESAFTVTAYVNIAAPVSDTGYIVSTLSQNWVEYNGSYTFTVTPQEGYTETPPEVTLMSLNGTLEKTSETDGVILYTVKNVTGPIASTDFTVTESIDVFAPASTLEYIVSGTSVNSVLYGGSYTFTVTPQAGYDNKAPLIVLNRNGTLSNVGNNYTVSGVTGPITPSDFTITINVNVEAPASGTGYTVNLSKNWAERGGSYTFTITPQAGYTNNDPLVTFGGTMSKSGNTYTVLNVTSPISASDFSVTVYLNVSAPTSDTGFTVSDLSTTWIAHNGTYTFKVTPQSGYTNKAPTVVLNRNGQLTNVGNTYTVSNVTAPIYASDFEITVYYNVSAPASDDGYTVGAPSQNWAEHNGSYTFTVTRQLTYTFPNITLNTSNGSLQSSKVGNIVTYTISNVTGPISSTDFNVQTEVRTYQISYRGLEEATAPALNSYTYEVGVSLVGVVPSARVSHNFVGWSLAQDGAIITEITPAQHGNIILWANWGIKTFVASFDSRGGNTINSLTIEYGNTLPAPVKPYLTGFYFDGWETASGTAWNFANLITENTTLYAKWIRLYFSLSYNEVVHNPLPNTHTYGTATTLQAPSKDNHDFDGWYIGSTKLTGGIIPASFLPQSINGAYTPGQSIIVTAQWAAHTYTITFENVNPNDDTVKQTKVLNFSALPYVLQPLDDTEYWLFKNWLNSTYLPITGQTLNISDFTDRKITVRAYWTAREMTVVFKSLSNGKFQDGTNLKTFTVPYNTYVTHEIPKSVVVDGVVAYHFNGWRKQNADLSIDTEPFNPNTTRITQNLTLVALWKLNSDAVKNILTQLGIDEETDIPTLEERYDDPAQEGELNTLVQLVKRALILTETDRIFDREALPSDVKTLAAELVNAIAALSIDREELLNKMAEHTYLGYLIADLNEYAAHPDYKGWLSDIVELLDRAEVIYESFITDVQLESLTDMTDEIIDFFKGKDVDVYERDEYLRPEPPFTFANPDLIQELQSLVDSLAKYTVTPLNAKLTEALSVTLVEKMSSAQTHLGNPRVLNSDLNKSIADLSQMQTAIFEHLANLVSVNTLQDLDTTIQDATEYSDDDVIWSKIGTALKTEIDTLILEAKSTENGYDDPMLYHARALYLIVKLNETMDKIDKALTDYDVWLAEYIKLETLLAEIDEYLETMEDGINKQALVAARATVFAILEGNDVDLQELTTAYYEALNALDSAKNPVDVPPSNNNNNLVMYIILGVAAVLAIITTILVIIALKKKSKRDKKPDNNKPKPSDLIIKNKKTNSKLAWMSTESDA